MDLAIGILRHAGRLQQGLVERRVVALRQGFDGAAAELVGGGAQVGLDLAAGLVEPLAHHIDARQGEVGGLPILCAGIQADGGCGWSHRAGPARWRIGGPPRPRGESAKRAGEQHGMTRLHWSATANTPVPLPGD